MTEIEIFRNNHLIDPQLHIWGWEVPAYLFLGGLAAGVMILSALASRGRRNTSPALRWMPFLAPVLLSLGMFALFLDLEFKLHVFRFYTAFRVTSPMSWGAWILLLIYPATIALALVRLTESDWRGVPIRISDRYLRMLTTVRQALLPRETMIETANVVLGVALGAYTGVLLGTLGARALWASALLAPLFLVSGMSTGAAAMALFPIADDERHRIVRWDVALIVAELALIALYFVGLSTSGEAGRVAAALFLGGGYTAAFWSIVVLAGLLLPLAIESLELRARLKPTVVASLLLLVGGAALRFILVTAGQSI